MNSVTNEQQMTQTQAKQILINERLKYFKTKRRRINDSFLRVLKAVFLSNTELDTSIVNSEYLMSNLKGNSLLLS